MLSLAQAATKRGDAGQALPPVYASLEEREARIYRGQLSMFAGPGGAGKSMLAANYVVKMGLPALYLILDQDKLSAAARFAAVATGDRFLAIKDQIDDYKPVLLDQCGHIMVAFKGESIDDVKRQLDAYDQRYGEPPTVLVVDNLGNMTSGYENEYAILKALTLELDELARELDMAVIGCAHTTDIATYEPLPRDKVLGKLHHFPRLIFSVGYNPYTNKFKVAHVKNSSGRSDINAQDPVTLLADPATMQITEPREIHPQVAQAYVKPVTPFTGSYFGGVSGN